MIDDKTIEQLLTSFYEGNTTPEEEEILLNYLSNKDINQKFYADSEVFAALYDASCIPLPDGFSKILENAIDEHIKQTTKPQRFEKRMQTFYIYISSAAAVVLLCLGLFFLTSKPDNSSLEANTYANPTEAAVVVEQALMLVSEKMKQGLAPLEKVKEGVEMTNRLLNETIKIN